MAFINLLTKLVQYPQEHIASICENENIMVHHLERARQVYWNTCYENENIKEAAVK